MDIPPALELNINNVALIIIDKQYGYVERAEKDGTTVELNATLPRIDNFIKEARKLGVKLVWTKMVENVDESPRNISVKQLTDSGYSERTRTNERSFEIVGEQPAENELVITKLYYDSFAQTDLHQQLEQSGITTVILAGGYTSRCVLGTAYGANGHGYNVIMCEDLVANPDKFADEKATTFKIINSILGWTSSSEEVLRLLQKSSEN